MKITENDYFLAKKYKKQDSFYISLSRKRPTLAGAFIEMLEVLSQNLINKECDFLLIDNDDQILLKDLQNIGFNTYGYLADDKLISLSDINLIAHTKKIQNIVLVVGSKIKHPSIENSKEFISFIRNRERYLTNLTELNPNIYKDTENLKSFNLQDNDKLRVDNSFSSLSMKRTSANGFNSPLESSEIIQLLNDSLSYTQSNSIKRPIACAGGLGNFKAYITNGDNNVEIYTPEDLNIKQTNIEWNNLLMDQIASNLETFNGCKTWLILSVDLVQLRSKYGARAYRFALMETGGLLHQLHLSATSYGFDFRILGGFDDKVVETLLHIGNEEVVTAICGLGK